MVIVAGRYRRNGEAETLGCLVQLLLLLVAMPLLKKLAVRMIGRNNSTSSRNVTESADCDMMRLLLQAARPI